MSFLENLNWRQAVKKMDPARKVGREDLDKVMEAIRMAPTSYGLQAFHVTVIENQSLKKELRQYSYDQSQVEDSAYLLVFSTFRTHERKTAFLKLLEENGNSKEKIERMAQALSTYENMNETDRSLWENKQVGIVLGFALAALAELKIDSCPIEGFSPSDYKRVLKLPEYLNPSVILPIGYRSDEEVSRVKVRFPKDDLFDFKS